MDNLAMASPDPALAAIHRSLHMVCCGHFARMPRHYMKRPSPDDHLLIWVVGGSGFVHTDRRKFCAKPGDLFTFLPGRFQEYGSDPSTPWDILWVHFHGEIARPLAQRLRIHNHAHAQLGLPQDVRDRFLDLVRHGEMLRPQPSPVSVATLNAFIRCNTDLAGLLGLMAWHLRAPTRHDTATRLDPDAIRQYMIRRQADPLPLTVMARDHHMSVSHFSRLFRQTFHVSPRHFLIQQRLAKACTLLRESSMPLKVISRMVGYSDPLYFSRHFTIHIGQSPTDYRRQRHS